MTWANDRLALHTWAVDTTPLAAALAAAKAGGFNAVELRWVDFLRCTKLGMSNADVIDLIRAAGIGVCTVGVEYGILFATGEESRRLLGVFAQCCRNAQALGCGQ